MTRYVIGPDVALHLARQRTVIRDDHQLLAPALIRSQLAYVRGFRIRRLATKVRDLVPVAPIDALTAPS